MIHVIDTVLELPVECLRNEDCQNDQICDLATGYCIEQPIAGTCADPFTIEGFGVISSSTAEEQENIETYNYNRGSCGGADGFEHVYRFEPQVPDQQVVDFCAHTINSSFDTVLYVRRTQCSDRAMETGCNDDNRGVTAQGGTSALTFRASQGDVFYIFVDAWAAGQRGDYNLGILEGSCEAQ